MKKAFALIILIIMTISFSWIDKAFAGAWTVPKHKVWGEYYMKWDWAKRRFTSEGKRKPIPGADANQARSWEFVQEPKLEFGVTDYLTALTSIEYKEGHYKEYDRPAGWGPFNKKHHGVTSVKLGGRLRITEKPFVFSTQSKVFIYPGYGVNHGEVNDFENQPGIGYGDDAFEQRVLIGKTFDLPIRENYKLPCYFGAETGYRWRTRHVCNDIPYFIEGGFWPVKGILLSSELDGYKCHPGTGSIKESYGILRGGVTWEVFGGDAILRKGNKLFNLQFQYGQTIWGKNTTIFQEWVLKVDTQF